MRVALFATCLADTFSPQTAKAILRLLERLGRTVDCPIGQTCCGQMHVNTGYQRQTTPRTRRYTEVFDGYDAVVAP